MKEILSRVREEMMECNEEIQEVKVYYRYF